MVAGSTVCLTVADGAGSKPQAARGSRLAVDTVQKLAFNQPTCAPDVWLHEVFGEVHRELDREANGDGLPRQHFAATLAIAVLIGDQLAIGQVGDTVVVVGGPAGYTTIDPAGHGEYANETDFITHSDWAARLRMTVCPAEAVDAIFLSTDGLRYKILDDLTAAKPYEPFFTDLAEFARTDGSDNAAIERFLSTVDDQTGDDKTLVVAVRT
ncbi:hypothetical protein Ate02nite_94010 [Paractinoplanes tereljensis]|uniref:PPM-type phosphatase domain-containing protein n=1 Tax=Paractinoplanes tereljensis TaxID=571912 RepID=A0A919NWM2_9ACTN|nr:hypothetical protein Ate02nite_94010 [Actinoplanes tereljensis]